MKFQIGDKILIKQTGEEGDLIAFIDKDMVKVRVKGVEYPIFEKEIDHPYLSWFLNKKISYPAPPKKYVENVPKEKIIVNNNRFQEQGIHLVFLPVYKNIDDDIIGSVKVYLSNNQTNGYSFNYLFDGKSGERFKIQSEIQSFSEFYIHDIDYEDFANNPFFELTGAEILGNIVSTIQQFDIQFNLKPKKLFAIVQHMHENGLPFFTQPIFEPDEKILNSNVNQSIEIKHWQAPSAKIVNKKPIDKIEQPIIPAPKVEIKKHDILPFHLNNPGEIDLHIEKLIESHEKLDNAQKLEIQLNAFEQAFDNALKTNLPKLFVIHGVGKGVLKKKIHSFLDQTKIGVYYVNEYSHKYGFGATEIFFGH